MRLPYLQVATEVIQQDARDLAVMLDWVEASAGWGMLKVFNWALSRCPDDAPPSANDIIRGPMAAKLIASVAGWDKDPMEFVRGCEQLPGRPLHEVEDGIRIRGLTRYDAAWGKNNPEAWKIWRPWLEARKRGELLPRPDRPQTGPVTVPEQVRSESVAKPERNRSESAPVSEHQTQMQTQMHTQLLPSEVVEAPPPKKENLPRVVEKPTSSPDAWTGREFFVWAQYIRQKANLIPEHEPQGLGAWWNACRLTPGVTADAMKRGFYAFGKDPFWEDKGFPFSAFRSQWEKYVRREDAHAA